MSLQDGLLDKWFPLVASLLVLPPWIWLAVRTRSSLQIISLHTIPYGKRWIWLIKTLALIVGAGGVFGAAAQLGMPWFLAIWLSGTVIFFALRESVQEIIPPKPHQDASAYQSSWRQYRHLRRDYMRSWTWFGAAFLTFVLIAAFADRLPKTVQIGLYAFCLLAVIASMIVVNLKGLKWLRWPCPRCGCAFRGIWGTPWLPKNCAYCRLPRAENARKPSS